jgi:hypothetical protein
MVRASPPLLQALPASPNRYGLKGSFSLSHATFLFPTRRGFFQLGKVIPINHNLSLQTMLQFMAGTETDFKPISEPLSKSRGYRRKSFTPWIGERLLFKQIDIHIRSYKSPFTGIHTMLALTLHGASEVGLGGCIVYYVWESRAFMTPPKKPLVYERLYV